VVFGKLVRPVIEIVKLFGYERMHEPKKVDKRITWMYFTKCMNSIRYILTCKPKFIAERPSHLILKFSRKTIHIRFCYFVKFLSLKPSAVMVFVFVFYIFHYKLN